MLEPRRDDIEALARSVFGARCRVMALHVVDRNERNLVIFATLVFPARVIVLKLAEAESPRAPFAREAAIQQRVARETAAPVCEVLAVDDSCQRFPWRYLMIAHAPGMDWRDGLARMSSRARYAIFRQLGEATAALHSLRYPRFGEVEQPPPLALPPQGEGNQIQMSPTTSPQLATLETLPDAGRVAAGREGVVEGLTARARWRIANPEHAALFVAVLQAHASDFASIAEPRLTHEDLNPSNLLVMPGDDEDDNWRIAALLDFESAWAGCPESDLARLDLWRGMMGDGFRQGYTAIRSIADDYPKRRPVYQLLWCLEYAQPTPAHHADTARVCAELGSAPVRFE